jgi:hypothetical protein
VLFDFTQNACDGCRVDFGYVFVADELLKIHKLKPTSGWRERFEKYLKAMPGYYYQVAHQAFFQS